LKSGDRVRIDLRRGEVNVLISDTELDTRRRASIDAGGQPDSLAGNWIAGYMASNCSFAPNGPTMRSVSDLTLDANDKGMKMSQDEAPKPTARSIYLRIAMAVVWFFVIAVIVQASMWVIVGIFSGGPTTNFNAAAAEAESAGQAFLRGYWWVLALFVGSFTAVLAWREFLPGTGRYKATK